MAYDKLLLADFETTGLEAGKHEIIEIGSILVSTKDLDVIWEYEKKLKPVALAVAEPKALEVNGYTPEAWENADAFIPGFVDFINRLDHTMIFTGQNVWFDLQFYLAGLRALNRRSCLDIPDPLDPTPHGYSYHRLDIASMAWPLQAEPVYRMSKLAPAFGLEPEAAPHRAINGVRKELELLKEIRRRARPMVAVPDVSWADNYQFPSEQREPKIFE